MGLNSDHRRAPSVTEEIHDQLFRRLVAMDLQPGQKISETEVAQQYDVSRQPVRDAFYRLSQQGLLRIRPQRATVVTHISIPALHRARFIRVALEKEVMLEATKRLSEKSVERLETLIERQREALAKGSDPEFYIWDEAFHAELCDIAGQPEVWELICDTKAPADRVRFLGLEFNRDPAIQDHLDLIAAMSAGDGASAANCVDIHLSRIIGALPRIQANHPACFKETI
jgi:DNA-binding GntR family transcriptional regulator